MINYSEVKKLIDEDVVDPQPDLNLVNQTLLNLVGAGLLNKEDKERYVFKEQVTWEVVYETLLYSERRYLHEIIASHIEKHKENEIELYAARLVYHYQKSENKKKIIFYSALAGDHAYSLFAIDDALEFYKSSLSNLESINNHPKIDKSSLLEHEADIMEAVSSFPEAISLYKKSLEVFDSTIKSRRTFLPWKVDLKNRMAQLNHKLSVVYEKSLNYTEALLHLDKAESLLPARPGLLPVKINSTRGVISYRQVDFDSATLYANKTIKIDKKNKDYSEIAYAYNIIANVYSLQGKAKPSIDYFRKALSTYKELSDINGISMSYFNLGMGLSCLPDFEQANSYYLKSMEINERMQNKLALLQDNFMIGNNKIFTKEYDEALSYFNKAIDIYKSGLDRKDYYGIILSRISEVFTAQNELVNAEKYIYESLDVLSELTQIPDKLAQAKVILVQLQIKQEKYKEAEILCHELISAFHDMDISQLEIHVKQQLGMIYTNQSKYNDAIDILRSAYDMSCQIDSLYDQYTVELKMLNVDVLKKQHNKKTLKRLHELLEIFKGYNDLEEVDFAESVIKKTN